MSIGHWHLEWGFAYTSDRCVMLLKYGGGGNDTAGRRKDRRFQAKHRKREAPESRGAWRSRN